MDKPALIKRNTERRAQGWKTAEISLDDFEALIAENERLTSENDEPEWHLMMTRIEDENVQIKNENEALRKDAERFRGMRAMTLAQIDDTQDEFDAEFDRQLDAAMGKGELS